MDYSKGSQLLELQSDETTDSISPSEERRRTGRYVAVGLVAVGCLLGLQQAFVQQNAVLAGMIVPALIMVCYVLWVLHTAKRTGAKLQQQEGELNAVMVVGEQEEEEEGGVHNRGADVP